MGRLTELPGRGNSPLPVRETLSIDLLRARLWQALTANRVPRNYRNSLPPECNAHQQGVGPYAAGGYVDLCAARTIGGGGKCGVAVWHHVAKWQRATCGVQRLVKPGGYAPWVLILVRDERTRSQGAQPMGLIRINTINSREPFGSLLPPVALAYVDPLHSQWRPPAVHPLQSVVRARSELSHPAGSGYDSCSGLLTIYDSAQDDCRSMFNLQNSPGPHRLTGLFPCAGRGNVCAAFSVHPSE